MRQFSSHRAADYYILFLHFEAFSRLSLILLFDFAVDAD